VVEGKFAEGVNTSRDGFELRNQGEKPVSPLQQAMAISIALRAATENLQIAGERRKISKELAMNSEQLNQVQRTREEMVAAWKKMEEKDREERLKAGLPPGEMEQHYSREVLDPADLDQSEYPIPAMLQLDPTGPTKGKLTNPTAV
jgi:hypothetical protein